MMKNPVQRAIDTRLSSLQITDRDVTTMMHNVREGKKVKRKLSAAFVLVMILVMLVATALAVMTLYAFNTNQNGIQTSGITFTADDVYFDGYLLIVPITMTPNDPGVTVYEDVLGDYDTSYEIEEILATGSTPLGAYCDIQLYDANGQRVGSLMTGTGERLDASYRMTFYFHFLPDTRPEELHVKVICGVMETPGQTVDDLEVFDFVVTSQEEVHTKSIKLTGNEGTQPYLDEVFIAQAENIVGIYVFFTGETNELHQSTIAFADTEAELPEAQYTGYDGTRDMMYIYHAIQTTEIPAVLSIQGVRLCREYLISLEDGAVTIVE